jgi:hypothetical protein
MIPSGLGIFNEKMMMRQDCGGRRTSSLAKRLVRLVA